MQQLKNLNDISRDKKKGLYKQWFYDKQDYIKVCDYMQKINFAIQDLNDLSKELNSFHMKNIIYFIVLVDWIKEAYEKIYDLINKDVTDKFVFVNEEIFIRAKQFFIAIRSFVVAHPLSTNRHKDYGFDGNYICVDIRNVVYQNRFFHYLDFDGLHNNDKSACDCYLYCYSDKDDNMKFFRIIGFNYYDIYKVVEIYIEKIYALDKFLIKQKRKDFI